MSITQANFQPTNELKLILFSCIGHLDNCSIVPLCNFSCTLFDSNPISLLSYSEDGFYMNISNFCSCMWPKILEQCKSRYSSFRIFFFMHIHEINEEKVLKTMSHQHFISKAVALRKASWNLLRTPQGRHYKSCYPFLKSWQRLEYVISESYFKKLFKVTLQFAFGNLYENVFLKRESTRRKIWRYFLYTFRKQLFV